MLIFVPGLLYADSLSFGNLELNSTPGSSVYLDGQYYGSVNPNGNFVATLGEEYADIEFIQIRIENRGFVPIERTYRVENLMQTSRLRMPLTLAEVRNDSTYLIYAYAVLGIGFFGIVFFLFSRASNNKEYAVIGVQSRKETNETATKEDAETNTSGPTEKFVNPQNEESENAKADRNGTKFDKYIIESHLADGGVATIYTAFDGAGKKIALKVMTQYLDDNDMVGKFIGEGWALQEIKKRFPKAPVIDVYDYGRKDQNPDGVPFIAMELIEGRSLDFFIKNNILPYEKKVEILRELASAIDAAHQCGVLHRDLSPDNILIKNSTDLTIRLIDFGVARHEVSWLKGTSVGAAFGKPEYMAPEQVEGGDLNYKVDYYSLGVLIYALFMGQPPFKHKVMYKVFEMHINENVPKMSEKVPVHIQNLVMELMSKEPENRPDNIDQILSKLK